MARRTARIVRDELRKGNDALKNCSASGRAEGLLANKATSIWGHRAAPALRESPRSSATRFGVGPSRFQSTPRIPLSWIEFLDMITLAAVGNIATPKS